MSAHLACFISRPYSLRVRFELSVLLMARFIVTYAIQFTSSL